MLLNQFFRPFCCLARPMVQAFFHLVLEQAVVDVAGQGVGMQVADLLVHAQVGNGGVSLVGCLFKVTDRAGVYALVAEFFDAGGTSGHEHADVVENFFLGKVARKLVKVVGDKA